MVKEITPEIERAGKALALALDDAGIKISAVAWVFETEDQRWRLNMLSPNVAKQGPRSIYEITIGLLDATDASTIKLEDVRLAATSSNTAIRHLAASVKVVKPGVKHSPRFTQSWFNEHYVDDAVLLWSRPSE